MQFKTSSGFTLIEILIVLTISVSIIGLVTVSFLRTKQTTHINNTVDKIISDLNNQQLKAMVGSTDGASTNSAYGIYFAPNSYVLFRGAFYSSTDSTNTIISFGEDIILSNISFPSSTIVFSKQSGEIVGFNPGNNSFTINNTPVNEQRTITINRYGVVTSITQ